MSLARTLEALGLVVGLLSSIMLSIDRLGIENVCKTLTRARQQLTNNADWALIGISIPILFGFFFFGHAYRSFVENLIDPLASLTAAITPLYSALIWIAPWIVTRGVAQPEKHIDDLSAQSRAKFLRDALLTSVSRWLNQVARRGKRRAAFYLAHMVLGNAWLVMVFVNAIWFFATGDRILLALNLYMTVTLTLVVVLPMLVFLVAIRLLESFGDKPEAVNRSLSVWGFTMLGISFLLGIIALFARQDGLS